MSDGLIFWFFAPSWSNFVLLRTHIGHNLHRANCRQVSHTHQIVGRAREGEDPVHFADSAMPQLAQERYGLQPAEAFFDPLPLSLAEGIPQMPCGAAIDRAPTTPLLVPGPPWDSHSV